MQQPTRDEGGAADAALEVGALLASERVVGAALMAAIVRGEHHQRVVPHALAPDGLADAADGGVGLLEQRVHAARLAMFTSAIASQSYGVCASCHATNMNMGAEA